MKHLHCIDFDAPTNIYSQSTVHVTLNSSDATNNNANSTSTTNQQRHFCYSFYATSTTVYCVKHDPHAPCKIAAIELPLQGIAMTPDAASDIVGICAFHTVEQQQQQANNSNKIITTTRNVIYLGVVIVQVR